MSQLGASALPGLGPTVRSRRRRSVWEEARSPPVAGDRVARLAVSSRPFADVAVDLLQKFVPEGLTRFLLT
jgi:hypothetical protein